MSHSIKPPTPPLDFPVMASPDGELPASLSVTPNVTCVLRERSYQIDAHIADIIELKENSLATAARTAELTATQVRLTTSLDSINSNLERGFALFGSVVNLFGRISIIFLVVVVALLLVVVYLTRTEIQYKDIHIGAQGTIRVPSTALLPNE